MLHPDITLSLEDYELLKKITKITNSIVKLQIHSSLALVRHPGELRILARSMIHICE